MYAGAFRFGAYLIETGDMTATDVYKVFFALAFCAASVGSASAYTQDYNKSKLTAAAQLFQFIDKKSDIDVVSCMGAKPVLKGKVTFDKVHFHYPSRNDVEVLRSLSFSVEPGKTLALVGASGCGKSTVVSLLERFYDPSEGKVMVDDMDIKALNLRYLRSHIGLVTQEPVLFDCSIRDNIAYGIECIEESNPQILFENIMQAAMIANIHNFIISLPQIVQDALDRAREGRTSIVIAHRLSTIENTNWIAMIHQGQVVEEGTHNSLKLKHGRYHKLIKKQQL